MDISLIHAGLAGGAALAAIPVILHLFMRQTPKRVVFPALRLIKERHKRARKTLKIKNWLLLLARMLLVALMALALARPRLFSQTASSDREVPTALGLVFDTSLSMSYKVRDKSLLELAKEQAYEILKKLPSSSQVFVVDSAEPIKPPSLSTAAARKRIEALAIRASNQPLNTAVGKAHEAVSDCDRPRHEVYVLTDLARSSWELDQKVDGLDTRKKVKSGVATYVVGLAPKEVQNVSLVEAGPTAAVVTQGESVEIRTKVRSQGPATKRTVVFNLDGKPRAREEVSLAANGEAELRFMTPKLDPAVPIHKGTLTLAGSPDPLEFDDRRFFTFKVQPAAQILIVSERAGDAQFVAGALDPDPSSLPPGTPRPNRVETISTAKFAGLAPDALKGYSAIFLLNAKQLAERDWGRLATYVREGGGLAFGVGDLAEPENYNLPIAAQLLPGTLKTKVKPKNTSFGRVSDLTHPLFSQYSKQITEMLSQVPVYQYWQIDPSKGSRTLLAFTDGAPALLERSFGGTRTGRVLLWTTPLSRESDSRVRASWNEFALPVGGNWSFWYLMKQTVPYLAGVSGEQLNFEVGQDAVIPIDPTHQLKNFVVQNDSDQSTETVNPPSDALVVVSPPIGQWTISATKPDGEKAQMGYSVNAPASEMTYQAIGTKEFDALFGKDQYKLAVDTESLQREVTLQRVGVEIFPWLMLFILLLITLENLLANRFHREGNPQGTLGVAT